MKDDDDNLEVIWSGKMPLLPDRPTRVGDTWRAPKRAWNRNTSRCDHKFVDSNTCLKCGWQPVELINPIEGEG